MSDQNQYAQAGVDIGAGQKAVELMKTALQSTYTPAVLSDTGNFGGLFDIQPATGQMKHPVLVASTDGVGTKTKVAARLNRWDTIGQDLVNHCINDILAQGARPLFFLDYVASANLDPAQISAIVTGMALACRSAEVVLLGGETAEMPGVYQSGEVDVVGTIIGVVDKADIIDGQAIRAGNAILNLPSTGLHTNGYSLARRILDDLDWTTPHPTLHQPIGEALLAVHKCYLSEIQQLQAGGIALHGLAHITGGGVLDNLPRILPARLGAVIEKASWTVPPIFSLIQTLGQVPEQEMFHAFNMGLGMLVVLPAEQVEQACALIPSASRVGTLVQDVEGVQLG